MKTKTQYDRLARLLTRKRGCTALEIIEAVGTTSPHSRLSEMKEKGWVIVRRPVPMGPLTRKGDAKHRGQLRVDWSDVQAPIRNSTSREAYRSPQWQVRDGAEQFLQVGSKGVPT